MVAISENARKVIGMKVENGVPLNEQQRAEILAAVAEIKASENYSINDLASMVQCSSSIISQLLRGQYTGDSDRWLLRLSQWISDRADRAKLPPVAFVATEEARQIRVVCQRAWTLPTMAQIVLDAGSGKSASLQAFVAERNRQGQRAVYLAATEACKTKRPFLLELAEALKVAINSRSNVDVLYRDIRQHLARFYNGGENASFLIVVDESTVLRPESINILRNLHDDPTVRCGVVLADTDRMLAALRDKHIAGGNEQLRSRFGAVYAPALDRATTRRDVSLLANSVVEGLGHEQALDSEAVNYLHALSNEPGRYRNVVQMLQNVFQTAEDLRMDATYTVEQLDYCAELIGRARKGKSPSGANPFGQRAGRSDDMRKTG